MLKLLNKIPTVAYFAGFVGCAVISYVLYPQTKGKRNSANRKNGYPRGLINYRNECFINVILQSLAASKKVTQWLLLNKSSTMSSKNLFDTLAGIVIRVNRLDSQLASVESNDKQNDLIHFDEDQDEFYAAQSFKAALNAHNWLIQSEEHDCHELFHLIMDVLDEENLETKKSLSSLNYFNTSHLKENSRLKTKNPFHGYLVSQLQCLDCNYKYPLRLESFYSLSLILPQKPVQLGSSINSITLIECINNYFKTDYITGMKCENCLKINNEPKVNETNKKGFIKKQAIAKLPDTLAIHIQRNSWSDLNLEMIKQTSYVQFPLNIKIDNPELSKQINTDTNDSNNDSQNIKLINLLENKLCTNSSFSLRQVGIGGLLGGNRSSNITEQLNEMRRRNGIPLIGTNQSYELRSAVVHYGSALTGHFVCFRKQLDKSFLLSETDLSSDLNSKPKSDDWLQISDSDIKICKQYHLLSSNVYMLFYDKISTQI